MLDRLDAPEASSHGERLGTERAEDRLRPPAWLALASTLAAAAAVLLVALLGASSTAAAVALGLVVWPVALVGVAVAVVDTVPNLRTHPQVAPLRARIPTWAIIALPVAGDLARWRARRILLVVRDRLLVPAGIVPRRESRFRAETVEGGPREPVWRLHVLVLDARVDAEAAPEAIRQVRAGLGFAWSRVTELPDGRLGIELHRTEPRHPLADPQRIDWASGSTARRETGAPWALDVPGDTWHVAVQGMTRSGKSVATYGIVGGLAEASARGAVIIGMIDWSGVLVSPWAAHPHAELRVGTGDLDAVVRVTKKYIEEMMTRLKWLDKNRRDKVPENTPRIVIIFEEFPGLMEAIEVADKALKPADRRHGVVLGNVLRLVQEGAKAGIRVVIIAQRADSAIIGGAAKSNIGTRISLRVNDLIAARMLHSDITSEEVAVLKEFAPGFAYVEHPGDKPEIIRFDLVEYEDYYSHVENAMKEKR